MNDTLTRFGLTPSDGVLTFGSECSRAALAIDRLYRTLPYDHRPWLDPNEEDLDAKRTEQYRVGYACFKYAVAAVLQPHVIVEIGVGSGIAAMAFSRACEHIPHYRYIGYDADLWRERSGYPFLDRTSDRLAALGIPHGIVRADSRGFDQFADCDFCHVDGDHSTEMARHDVAAAWRSGAKWILVDDARDTAVMLGTFLALSIDLQRGSVDCAYFGDTWTGNMLIRTDHYRAENQQ